MTVDSAAFRRVIAVTVVGGAAFSAGMLARGGHLGTAVVAGVAICLFNLSILSGVLLVRQASRPR
jgi:hypothetical protein